MSKSGLTFRHRNHHGWVGRSAKNSPLRIQGFLNKNWDILVTSCGSFHVFHCAGSRVLGGKFDEALVAWFFGNSLSAICSLVIKILQQNVNPTSNHPTHLHDM